MLSEIFLCCLQASLLDQVATLSSLTLIFLLLCIDLSRLHSCSNSAHHCSMKTESTIDDYENIINLFSICNQNLYPNSTKQYCIHTKDSALSAFYQLWKAMCIRVKTQNPNTQVLWRVGNSAHTVIPSMLMKRGWKYPQNKQNGGEGWRYPLWKDRKLGAQATHWPSPVNTTFNNLDHISRSQQC